MTKVDRRVTARMELALDEAFEGVPHGGDHESRKYVVEMLLESAGKGNATLDELRAVGRDAFQRLSARGQADLSVNPAASVRVYSYR
jgi:hypothetical protein